MASKRSEQSRLYDNIRRRIRHINEKMQDPDNDAIREEGLRRNKEELESYLKGLREKASKNPDKKLTNEDIYRAVDRLKTDDNLSANLKKMDEVTIKSVISDEKFRKEMTAEIRSNPELNDLISIILGSPSASFSNRISARPPTVRPIGSEASLNTYVFSSLYSV